jgi:hypothetical protein
VSRPLLLPDWRQLWRFFLSPQPRNGACREAATAHPSSSTSSRRLRLWRQQPRQLSFSSWAGRRPCGISSGEVGCLRRLPSALRRCRRPEIISVLIDSVPGKGDAIKMRLEGIRPSKEMPQTRRYRVRSTAELCPPNFPLQYNLMEVKCSHHFIPFKARVSSTNPIENFKADLTRGREE